ncbi:MAG TPA: hypothetical protein VL049_06295 [Candidatus Dormibacteraeota bacterium]|nr:hypothetical protein [Candidatus Dormibacteraeota bacterium]
MRQLLILAALLIAGPALGQQCCGDCNGDGSVAINELVTAVGSALNSCVEPVGTPTRNPTATKTSTPRRTPTPATCPFKFNDEVASDFVCGYAGTADAPCDGTFDESAVWFTSGTTVTVDLFDASDFLTIEVYAQRTSPTTAKVIAVAKDADPEQRVNASGMISIPSSTRLKVTFNAGTNCDRQSFDGTFDDFYSVSFGLRAGQGSLRRAVPTATRTRPNFTRLRH